MKENMEISMEKTKENMKLRDILYPIGINEIFLPEEYKFEFVFFKVFSEEKEDFSEISEIINKIIDMDYKEIEIINMEDKKVIVISTNTNKISEFLKLNFSIGKYFYKLDDDQYGKLTSKYIDKNCIYVKTY